MQTHHAMRSLPISSVYHIPITKMLSSSISHIRLTESESILVEFRLKLSNFVEVFLRNYPSSGTGESGPENGKETRNILGKFQTPYRFQCQGEFRSKLEGFYIL